MDFTTASDFILEALQYLAESRRYEQKPEIQIVVNEKSKTLTDLFRLGRLLSFLRLLKEEFDVLPSVSFTLSRAEKLENLDALNFFSFCDAHKIPYQLPDQLVLMADAPRRNQKIPDRRNYWRCILPLTEFQIDPPYTEEDASATVQRILGSLAEDISRSLESFSIDTRDLSVELTRIFFVAFRELLSNSLLHSGSKELLVALTIQRTSDRGQGIRNHAWSHHGHDRFELLVMDFGAGVMPTVLQTLGRPQAEANYFEPGIHRRSFRSVQIQEQSLLSNIFRGNLVIRKGRRSEGLYELGRTLSWFDGTLNFFSGRTELQVSASTAEDVISVLGLPLKRTYFLPGTIATLWLPSHSLKVNLLSRGLRYSDPTPDTLLPPESLIRSVERIPRGFFGAIARGYIRRRSELDAHSLITQDSAATADISAPLLWELNLKLSDGLDVNYFDSLIQELCKYSSGGKSGASFLRRLIFTNVPRRIINSLQQRNCISFLVLHETHCLILDETDTPHLLGIPRLTDSLIDVEEILYGILGRKKMHTVEIAKRFKCDTDLLTFLKHYVVAGDPSGFGGGVFYYENDTFLAIDIQHLLGAIRASHLKQLNDYIIPSADTTGPSCVKLLNGRYVDRIHNFSLVTNGDRLAAIIQRISRIPQLYVFDPLDPSKWRDLEGPTDTVIVLDALYTGDETGYVGELIGVLKEKNVRVKEILVCCDFRKEQSETFEFGGLETAVVSIQIPSEVVRPKTVEPVEGDSVLDSLMQLLLAPPSISPAESSTVSEWRPFKYSQIELSTEFWQNVSSLGLLSTSSTGTESRKLIFYESNQRLLTHPRLRRAVGDYVSQFVRHVLELKVDVIIHPNHAVGNYLAQLVFAQIDRPPVILPLPQRLYGSHIELSLEQYHRLNSSLQARRASSGRRLRALIVDDSVVTGATVFSMCGIARKFDLAIVGCLTLFSRSTPEISEAISGFGFPFAYLYRLHMPLLSGSDSPQAKVDSLREKIFSAGVSYFAQFACSLIGAEAEHLWWRKDEQDDVSVPYMCSVSLDQLKGRGFIPDSTLRHMISGLMLHPDPVVIDLDTRTAIAYNFMDVLIEEEAFWDTLEGLYLAAHESGARTSGLVLCRRLIFLVGHSRCAEIPSIRAKLEQLCGKLGRHILASPVGTHYSSIFVELCVCLAAIGSTAPLTFLEHAVALMPRALRYGNVPYEHDASEALASQEMIAAIAWAITALGVSPRIGSALALNATQINSLGHLAAQVGESRLLVIDLLGQLLFSSGDLRSVLGVEQWMATDAALEYLSTIALASAPARSEVGTNSLAGPQVLSLASLGYSAILQIIMRICKADTALLYSRNIADEEYTLTTFQSRAATRPADDLEVRDLRESALPEGPRQRMQDGLFFFSTADVLLAQLNKCSVRSCHGWALGVPIHTGTQASTGLRYYVILAYEHLSQAALYTCYYYWLRLELTVRLIIPRIHHLYTASSTALNALCQTIRPVHPVTDRIASAGLIGQRRRVLKAAQSSHDIGDLIRRTVRMATEPVLSLRALITKIESRIELFRSALSAVSVPQTGALPTLFGDLLDRPSLVGLSLPPWTFDEQEMTFSIRTTVLEFLLIETIGNALAYFRADIVGQVTVETVADGKSCLVVQITNDRVLHEAYQGTGVAACKAAASAVGGDYFVGETDDAWWMARIRLPMTPLPERLATLLKLQ